MTFLSKLKLRRRISGLPWLVAANWAMVMTAVVVVFFPDVAHYWVDPPSVSSADILRLRKMPSDEVLQLIERQRLGDTPPLSGASLRAAANAIVQGRLELPRANAVSVRSPFSASDLDSVPAGMQLAIASLVPADLLLRAYAETRDSRYSDAARGVVLAFAEYERGAWFPRGLLWNDHAIAARVQVLIEVWRLSRGSDRLTPESARTLVEFAARSAELLARPSHFTAATNHGVMQNIALLQVAIAFPELQDAPRYREIATERLIQQLPHYINAEGVVLEHSAGYQQHGLKLLDYALALLRTGGLAVPPELEERLTRGQQFLDLLRRPDGSLPLIGDTPASRAGGTARDIARSLLSADPKPGLLPQDGAYLFPIAGYGIWWSTSTGAFETETRTQTVFSWSHFPGHGHKHADEMSVQVWAHGRSWLTNTGYWPYSIEGRALAEGWRGSNAPHLRAESATSARRTALRGSGTAPGVRFLELERTLADGSATLRRQVIEIGASRWLVLDALDAPSQVVVDRLWTFPADSDVEPNGDLGYQVQVAGGQFRFRVTFASTRPLEVSVRQGSMTPFGGWIVIGGTPTPAPSLEVSHTTQKGAVVSLFELQGLRSSAGPAPEFARYTSAEEWAIVLSGSERIERSGNAIRMSAPGGSTVLTLHGAPDVGSGREPIESALRANLDRYPKHRDLWDYRVRVGKFLLLLWAVQELFFLTLARWWPSMTRPLRVLAAGAWGLLGIWLTAVYFRT